MKLYFFFVNEYSKEVIKSKEVEVTSETKRGYGFSTIDEGRPFSFIAKEAIGRYNEGECGYSNMIILLEDNIEEAKKILCNHYESKIEKCMRDIDRYTNLLNHVSHLN